MKLICTLTCLLFPAAAVFAQTNSVTLRGRITDASTGAPIPGASISFSEARIGTIADTSGYYQFRRLRTGHYLAEVSSAGYSPIVVHIDAESDLVQNFSLRPSVVENRGVIVTGVAASTSTRNAPVPVTLVRRGQLLEAASTNIIDALTRQPGVSQIGTGPAISKPVIRGLSYNRVVVVNDGQRQEGQQWGDEHGVEIDELSVNRVEILKGASSLMYGSDAIGGVVHFITNVPVPEGSVRANVLGTAQSNNGQLGVHTNIAGNVNGFNWNAYGTFRSAADYRNKYDGRVFNSRFNERNFGGYIGLNKHWGFSHLIVSSFNQRIGMVEGERDEAGRFLIFPENPLERAATDDELASRKLYTPYQGVQHYRVISDNSFRAGRSRIKLNVGYQQNIRREFGEAEDPGIAGLHFDLRTVSYNLQWHLPEGRGWQTTLGLSGMYQQNRNLGDEVIIPEYNLFDAGGFLFVQRTFKKTTVTGGLRYDNRSLDSKPFAEGGAERFTAFDRNFHNASGSLGLSHQPSDDVTLRANVARGFRAPTVSELSANGAHEGTNRFEYGTRGLRSEKSWQFDAGAELDYDHVSFTASVFYNHIRDFIFYQRLAAAGGGDSLVVTTGGEELEAFQYAQHNASLVGFELTSDIHPHPFDWLHWENSFSIVRGRFSEPVGGSRNLPSIPAAHWVTELRAAFPKAGRSLRNAYVRVELDRTFRQSNAFLSYNTETPTPGYGLLNAGIGGDVLSKGKVLFTVHLTGTNLTDVAYQNHLARLKYAAVNEATGRRGVFNMGRNFSVKVNVPLEWRIGKRQS
ncbi:TonB-dependent receptor [Flaviaesturariibacter amylovorans]|uniref:TonB-dependent receptor n=1 Tax=Flaviaesturariibacter amylovorans TaxID=1084520 RepID=A0ABP8H9Q2_9BACT